MGKSKKSSDKDQGGANGNNSDDGRFDISKPHFRTPKESSTKIKIDERFASVLTDDRFQVQVKDKYGRKKKKKGSSKDDMREFYTVDDEKEEETASNGDESSSSPEDGDNPESRIAYLNALSRGEVDISSSSEEEDSDESSDDNSSEDDNSVMGKAGILDPTFNEDEVEVTEEKSNFLAVMNMDWSNVRAVDVFSILSSFAPPGAVKQVKVFPSDFGVLRMEQEEKYGPSGLWKQSKTKVENDCESSVTVDNNDGDDSSNGSSHDKVVSGDTPNGEGTDFDAEKLRAYEASRLKYYFAVAEFVSDDHADIAYKEVDGLEFEYSRAALDLRYIPVGEIESVTKDRPLRDACSALPSNYVPPEFVVNALQKTTVDCSWELGDRDRQQALTKYRSGQAWSELAEGDDLKAYLASDNSSDEEDEGTKKASRMRQMLGLDSDGESQTGNSSDGSSTDESDQDADIGQNKSMKFIPGQNDLAGKIQSKLEGGTGESATEHTPWEKYKAKRKEKRSEKRRQARERRKEARDMRSGRNPNETKSKKHDSFFLTDGELHESKNVNQTIHSQTKEELELLVAGDGGDEETRDFNMRGLQRIEKNKGKNLKGSRKRKEDRISAEVSGAEFKVDVADDRFKSMLDGSNELFGIDRTNPNYKETSAMQAILQEQTRRRKDKKRKKARNEQDTPLPDVSADSVNGLSTGASALSALVSSLKSKVGKQ